MADPISLGLAGLSIAGGLLSKRPKMPKMVMPDISGELAKLDELFAQKGALLHQTTEADIAKAKRGAASSLAARGIYSSPVAEKSMNEVRRLGLLELARGQADILGQQAAARSSALNSLLGYRAAADRANLELAMSKAAQSGATRRGLLGGGAALLLNSFRKNPSAPGTQNSNINLNAPGYNDLFFALGGQ